MDKKTLLAIVLSTLVIIAWQFYISSVTPKPLSKPILKEQTPVSEKVEEAVIDKKIKKDILNEERREVTRQIQAKEEDLSIETDLYKAVISNKEGGVIKSWRLKDYFDNKKDSNKEGFLKRLKYSLIKKEKECVELIGESEDPNLEALSQVVEINMDGKNVGIGDNANYQVLGGDKKLNELKEEKEEVIFKYIDSLGIAVEREMIFYKDKYYIDVNITEENLSLKDYQIRDSLAWGRPIGQEKKGHHSYKGPSSWNVLKNKKEKDVIKDKKVSELVSSEQFSWVAMEDNYFAAVLIPQGNNSSFPDKESQAIKFSKYVSKNKDGEMLIAVQAPFINLRSGEKITKNYRVYIGPKEVERLKVLGNNVENVIDYGFFGVIAKPLAFLLKYFYKYTKNYGLAIIFLTVLIKLIFYPLTDKSMKSMKATQVIQPEMTALREKYKKDPQRLNKEIMELYKKHKVNPVGGCLPMLIQIPVFFALYKALLVSIELRNAPFFLWITDLSSRDPLFVTPILTGVTMYYQQKMMPMGMGGGNQKQMQMMRLFPVFLSVLFINFPSGLVLYFLVNNVITIGEQYYREKKSV
ncbi:MAG: membrane protein insertase YidC [bacterium]